MKKGLRCIEDKMIDLKNHDQIMELLDKREVSSTPVHTGWGVEIYENHDLETQIIVNWRTMTIQINEGYA